MYLVYSLQSLPIHHMGGSFEDGSGHVSSSSTPPIYASQGPMQMYGGQSQGYEHYGQPQQAPHPQYSQF